MSNYKPHGDELQELANEFGSTVFSVNVALPGDQGVLNYTVLMADYELLKNHEGPLGEFYFDDARYAIAKALKKKDGDSNSE